MHGTISFTVFELPSAFFQVWTHQICIAMVKDFHEFLKTDFRFKFLPEITQTPVVRCSSPPIRLDRSGWNFRHGLLHEVFFHFRSEPRNRKLAIFPYVYKPKYYGLPIYESSKFQTVLNSNLLMTKWWMFHDCKWYWFDEIIPEILGIKLASFLDSKSNVNDCTVWLYSVWRIFLKKYNFGNVRERNLWTK